MRGNYTWVAWNSSWVPAHPPIQGPPSSKKPYSSSSQTRLCFLLCFLKLIEDEKKKNPTKPEESVNSNQSLEILDRERELVLLLDVVRGEAFGFGIVLTFLTVINRYRGRHDQRSNRYREQTRLDSELGSLFIISLFNFYIISYIYINRE